MGVGVCYENKALPHELHRNGLQDNKNRQWELCNFFPNRILTVPAPKG